MRVMNIVQLVFKDWELEVELEGGRISVLKKNGILILGSFERIDGKRGNTHLCAPNFANDGVKEFGLPFHGPFRNAPWILINKGDDVLEIACENMGLDIHQFFSFNSEYFIQKIAIENKSEENKPINIAVHNYWSSDLGWGSVRLNDFDVSMGIKNNEFTRLRQMNEINIPGKPLIKWQLMGFNYAKLWTGFLEEMGSKIFDNNYFCLEPVMRDNENFFGSPESMLYPKTKIELRQMIGVVTKTV
jgi:hypothetical protein